jgi:uncharacterized membrane protein
MGSALTSEPATVSRQARLDAIDLLRGSVMVLMALDHVRDFISNAPFDPLDLSRTNAAYFFTRWITHFCAPVFVFLAGTGAFLYGSRGKTKPELAWFLLTRGLWLVFLELTLIHLGWSFRLEYHLFVGQVFWAIGCSMVLLAGLVFLPTWVVTALGALIVAGHHAFDGTPPEQLGSLRWLWVALCSPGPIELAPDVRLFVIYPVLPWFGVMAAGYGFGTIWLLDQARRRRWLVGLGLALVLGFVVLRYINRYGDPNPWSVQSTDLLTLLSFLNCTKYPPSLLYVLMTLGPAILVMAWFTPGVGPLGRPLVIFGRVPLFYYLLHTPVIHLTAVVLALVGCGEAGFLFQHPILMRPPEGYGFGLPVVYAVWMGVVLLLFPPCYWYATFKGRRRDWWLGYL